MAVASARATKREKAEKLGRQSAALTASRPWPDRELPLWHWAVWTLISLMLLASFLHKGWIMDVESRSGIATTAIAVSALYLWVRPELPWRDWRWWGLLTLAAMHLLNLPLVANTHAGLAGAAYAVVGLMLALLARGLGARRGSLFLWNAMLTVTLGILLGLGLLAMVGLFPYKDAVLYGRLASVLQYPNTTGALALVFCAAAMGTAEHGRSWSWRVALLHLGLLAFLLSGSRGAQLVALPALTGLVLTMYRQFPGAPLLVGWSGILSVGSHLALIRLGIGAAVVGPAAWNPLGLLIIVGGAVLSWLGAVGLERWAGRLTARQIWLGAAGVVLTAGAGVWLSPLGDRIRVALTETDAGNLGRLMHLQDAWQVALAHPLGVGFLGWRALYAQFQSVPYTINILHSHLAETLVEIGFPGIAGLLAVWVTLTLVYIRAARTAPAAEIPALHGGFWGLLALGLHSWTDVDLNYIALLWLAYCGWGLLYGVARRLGDGPSPTRASAWQWGGIGLLAVAAVAFLTSAWWGSSSMAEAGQLASRKDLGRAVESVRRAMTLAPWDPDIHEAASRYLGQWAQSHPEAHEEAEKALLKAVALDPYNPVRRHSLGILLAGRGRLPEAREALVKATQLAPWRGHYWQTLLEFQVQLAEKFQERGDQTQVRSYAQAATATIAEIQTRQAATHSQPGEYQFQVDATSLEQIQQRLAKLKMQ